MLLGACRFLEDTPKSCSQCLLPGENGAGEDDIYFFIFLYQSLLKRRCSVIFREGRELQKDLHPAGLTVSVNVPTLPVTPQSTLLPPQARSAPHHLLSLFPEPAHGVWLMPVPHRGAPGARPPDPLLPERAGALARTQTQQGGLREGEGQDLF